MVQWPDKKITGPNTALFRSGRSRGYAAEPGSGPDGQTCKTCAHYYLKAMGKTYRKCSLMRAIWTGGPGTDIKAGSPACAMWQQPPLVSPQTQKGPGD